MSRGTLPVESWRLLELIRAYRTQKEPLEESDVTLLDRIANATCDLHEACHALERGCALEQAVLIFT